MIFLSPLAHLDPELELFVFWEMILRQGIIVMVIWTAPDPFDTLVTGLPWGARLVPTQSVLAKAGPMLNARM